jgi:hypothetical protein
MYKNKSALLKDFLNQDSVAFKQVYFEQLKREMNYSHPNRDEGRFLDRFLLSNQWYNSAMNFIQSHFMREFQDENLYHIKLIWYTYLFKDIGWELWNKESYKLWNAFSWLMNDTEFMIIEDDYTMGEHPLGLNFNFPLTMSWEDFYEGGYISATLFYENFYSYFMLWSSTDWFRYIETDGHRELREDREEEVMCDDYLGLRFITPEIEKILKKLGFVRI